LAQPRKPPSRQRAKKEGPGLRRQILSIAARLGALAALSLVLVACDSSGTIVSTDAASDARTFDVITFDAPTPFDATSAHDAGGRPDAADGADGVGD
jgi:hypothetical protein